MHCSPGTTKQSKDARKDPEPGEREATWRENASLVALRSTHNVFVPAKDVGRTRRGRLPVVAPGALALAKKVVFDTLFLMFFCGSWLLGADKNALVPQYETCELSRVLGDVLM